MADAARCVQCIEQRGSIPIHIARDRRGLCMYTCTGYAEAYTETNRERINNSYGWTWKLWREKYARCFPSSLIFAFHGGFLFGDGFFLRRYEQQRRQKLENGKRHRMKEREEKLFFCHHKNTAGGRNRRWRERAKKELSLWGEES